MFPVLLFYDPICQKKKKKKIRQTVKRLRIKEYVRIFLQKIR